MLIPEYITNAGQFYPETSLNGNDRRICIVNTTFDECLDYSNTLCDYGFVKRDFRLIPSRIKEKKNLYFNYIKDDKQITVFWESSLQIARIIIEPLSELKAVFQKNTKLDVPLSLTQLKLEGFGMGYAVQLRNGNFILIDGGYYLEKDVYNLYQFLKGKVPKNEKIVIETWFFTHSDSDHLTLAIEFMKKYHKEVEVESFSYQFPDYRRVKMLVDNEIAIKNVSQLQETIKSYYPNAIINCVHTGQLFKYDGVNVEVLFSIDDTVPTEYYQSANDMSLVLRFEFDNGKVFLSLGDIISIISRQLAFTYGQYLKSNFLQIAHHGLLGGDTFLYSIIDPDVCFWDIIEERYNGTRKEDKYHWAKGDGGCDYNAYIRNDKIKKRIHLLNNKNNIIEI